jgi:hypothetical protein
VVLVFGVPARTNPVPGVVGKVSVTLVTVIGPAFGLVMVMVKVEVLPAVIAAGAKALAMVGAAAVTVRLAVFETTLAGACVVVIALVVFGLVPGVLLRTITETVQEPDAGMVMPLKLNAVWFTVKLLLPAPVQVPVAAPVALMNMLLKVSVKLALVSAMPLVLVSVKSI